jgi:hypothetical protein
MATTPAGVGRLDEFHTGCCLKKSSGTLGDPLADSQMTGIVVRYSIHTSAMKPDGRALVLKVMVEAKRLHQKSHGILVPCGQGTGSILPHRVILKEGPKVL